MKKLLENRDILFRIILYIIIAVFFVSIVTDYVEYMNTAKSTVPIMDYWQWIAVYGQRVQDGTLTFRDYFNSDFGEHIQPMCMAINFLVLKISHFDVKPLVEWGMWLRVIVTALIVILFVWRQRNTQYRNYLLQLICAIAICMSVLNYNQWEMTTEPFSLTNAFRIANYFLSFYFADIFVKGIATRKMRVNLIYGALLGCFCAYLTIFVGAAYFVGHLVAIGVVMLWTLLQQRQAFKKYFWPMAVWAAISFIAACAYYILVSRRGVTREDAETTKNVLVLIIQAVCYFWGGLFVHDQTVNEYGSSLITMVGAFVLIYSVVILIRYLKTHREGKELFPAMCLIYALILSVAISVGRVTLFGAGSLAASRYVVETGIGLVGTVWMTYSVAVEHPFKKIKWAKYTVCVYLVIAMLSSAAAEEMEMAPYRKIYNDNLAEMMTHLEDYTDDELGVFQANSPDFVRYCVEFFKENNLSFFYEAE